ncbi:MAG: adenylate cyclase, partial [Pseudanabaena sp.]
NVASRICTAAHAGEIFISESTKSKISSLKLPLEQLDLIKVKGKDEPLQLYRVNWENIDIREILNKTKTLFPKFEV